MVDLRALLTNNPGMTLTELNYISDRGEIAGDGVLPNGDNRAILLVPCDEDHSDVEGCDFETFEPTTMEALNSTLATSAAAGAVSQSKAPARRTAGRNVLANALLEGESQSSLGKLATEIDLAVSV